MKLPEKIEMALKLFIRLPGIGEKTALKFILKLLKWNEADLYRFSESLKALSTVSKCGECGVICDQDLCFVCSSSQRRADKMLCVIADHSDYFAIERSGGARGCYHVLGGVLDPLSGIGPEDLTIEKLLSRIKRESIKEVILALNPSVEGDVTCNYIKELLSEDVVVKKIGMGVPVGGNLEYLDSLTISKAFENSMRF